MTDYENIDTEFKEVYVPTIKKTVIAFANTLGGKLYIGIQDDGKVVGVENTDEVMQQVANMLKDSISPDVMPFVNIMATEREGKHIVAVVVNTGSSKPYYLKEKGLKPTGVYVRKGSSNQPLSEEGIRNMIIESSNKSFEELRSLQQDLHFEYVKQRFAKKGLKFGEAQMHSLHILDDQNLFTNLGFLLSDECTYSIKAAVFQGNDRRIFRNRQEFSGSVLKQLYDVFEYVDKYNQVKATFPGLERVDTLDYPREAMREMLINAIIHRDYGNSDSTLVCVFKNRVECISGGGLVPGMSEKNMMTGYSKKRNPNLANVFYRLELIESYGTGIEKIMSNYEGCKDKPMFMPVDGVFKVILPNFNEDTFEPKEYSVRERVARYVVTPSSNPESYTGTVWKKKEATAQVQDSQSYWGEGQQEQHTQNAQGIVCHVESVSRQEGAPVDSRYLYSDELKVMQLVQANGYVTRKMVEELLQVKTTKAYMVLQALVDAGRLQTMGVGRSRKYVGK